MSVSADSMSPLVELLREEAAPFGIFLLVTFVLGGGAAMLAGRAVAATWRPQWQIVVYALVLGGAVRFMHFALFGETLLSLRLYGFDSAICIVWAFLGFRATRAWQMVRQYPWIYEPSGPLRWRRKAH
jgi:hypothetical protein